jgi:hypothetical protein
MHPLVAEAMKKAAIVWLRVGAAPAYPVWCLAVDDALYVVTGGAEQPAPGLAPGADVGVSARGDHGGRIVAWTVTAERVAPGSETWQAVTPQLAAKRLNASGAAEAVVTRWAGESALFRLAPLGEIVDGHDLAEAGSEAAPPLPTPAARRSPKPFRLHRVKRR